MTSFRNMLCLLVLPFFFFSTASAQDLEKTQGVKQPNSSVFVDPINLTQVTERILTGLRLGAAVLDPSTANGIQEAADVWGLHVDLFRLTDQRQVSKVAEELMHNGAAVLIVEGLPPEDERQFEAAVENESHRRGSRVPVIFVGSRSVPFAADSVVSQKPTFDDGFAAVRRARNQILPLIPKFDELFNIAFPITPLPDTFFQATKFPYPDPVIRSVRTVSSTSASAHAHTSCHAVALLGNMIHHTSKVDDDVFLLGFEGGNLSIKAAPGAVSREKLSSVMTAYVFAIRGDLGDQRDLLSENDGKPTSAFRPSFHSPEQLGEALNRWKASGEIKGFQFVSQDELILDGFKGQRRKFRASFFIISTDRKLSQPELEIGVDRYGRWVFEMTSTQKFTQLFSEVPLNTPAGSKSSIEHLRLVDLKEQGQLPRHGTKSIAQPLLPTTRQPVGGLINEAGSTVGATVGFPLGSILYKVSVTSAHFQPYIMAIEGGFLVVTPETPLKKEVLQVKIKRLDFDERGPLGSDQTLTVSLEDGQKIVFRRTILQVNYLTQSLEELKDQALISGWEFVGARGQGLESNVVLYNFLGKNRKFMSSLNTWPSNDRSDRPHVRWYVDGMQRLNFSLVTPEGWRQEFVEVPLEVTPIPRDVELFSGISKLE